tara:strand:+ start:498 stop:917 length:420 start_codon:yes stop_codon:yes gene_type:complete
MESIELEKQVEQLLETPKFEQLDFEQSIGASLKEVFSKNMLVSALGTSLSVNVGSAVQSVIPLGAAPVGVSSVVGGVLLHKIGGKNPMIKNLALGIIQGGIATALTPISSMIGGMNPFSQKLKEETTQELNPLVKGVMW